jgi:putative tricarboxylic transport membrane protein
MKRADQITGIVVFIFSGFVIQEAWQMPKQSTFEPGVGFFPLWLGVLMATLSVILMVTSWLRSADSEKKTVFPGRQALTAIVLLMAGLAVYILLLEVLGFLVDTMFFAAYLMRVVMREKWKMALLIAVITSASLYLIFQILLQINLPKNMLGF